MSSELQGKLRLRKTSTKLRPIVPNRKPKPVDVQSIRFFRAVWGSEIYIYIYTYIYIYMRHTDLSHFVSGPEVWHALKILQEALFLLFVCVKIGEPPEMVAFGLPLKHALGLPFYRSPTWATLRRNISKLCEYESSLATSLLGDSYCGWLRNPSRN